MKRLLITVALLFTSLTVYAQYNGYNFSISSNLVYTTSAEIYLNPNAVDPVIRNRSFEIQDVLNPSLDLRYRISEPLIAGICIEYMNSSQTGRNLAVYEGNNEIRLETEDGFILIPVEASVYYVMPFSTQAFKFLMGAGVGVYTGEFTRKFGDTDVSTIERQSAFGIQVSISMEYLPLERLGMRFEMKFRDPEFKTRNRYNKDTVIYNGTEITILRNSFDAKINVNGVTFLLGAAFYF
jgi:hypothetical protein